jgi:hypothetical protein
MWGSRQRLKEIKKKDIYLGDKRKEKEKVSYSSEE